MTTITTQDGTEIFFKDWGAGRPVVLSHGWPLNSDAWDAQMVFLSERGYRVVAHDRRGHGRSSQPSDGNDMDAYADDLAELIEELDLRGIVLVGHSTGGGEVTRYVGRHGTERVAGVVLVDAVVPRILKTDANPNGIPLAVFDELRAGVLANRSQVFKDFPMPFYGYNREGAKISQGVIDAFWLQAMQGGAKGEYECITLIVHGDDDQIVPIETSGLVSSKLVKDARLKIYQGGPHGLATTRADEFNADLLEFIESVEQRASATESAPLTH